MILPEYGCACRAGRKNEVTDCANEGMGAATKRMERTMVSVTMDGKVIVDSIIFWGICCMLFLSQRLMMMMMMRPFEGFFVPDLYILESPIFTPYTSRYFSTFDQPDISLR